MTDTLTGRALSALYSAMMTLQPRGGLPRVYEVGPLIAQALSWRSLLETDGKRCCNMRRYQDGVLLESQLRLV
jgi:hypothetical protein